MDVELVWARGPGGRRQRRPGRRADGPSSAVAVTADTTRAAFVSEASNLVPGDTNGAADVFRWTAAPSDGAGAGDGGTAPAVAVAVAASP